MYTGHQLEQADIKQTSQHTHYPTQKRFVMFLKQNPSFLQRSIVLLFLCLSFCTPVTHVPMAGSREAVRCPSLPGGCVQHPAAQHRRS